MYYLFIRFSQIHWIIQEWNKWLSLQVSHWIIHLINLFENTATFLYKTLILSETTFNSAWAWWTKKNYKATVSYLSLSNKWSNSFPFYVFIRKALDWQVQVCILDLQGNNLCLYIRPLLNFMADRIVWLFLKIYKQTQNY